MYRRDLRLALFFLVGIGGGALIGCEDNFSDDKFGVLDLASTYDGGTAANPAAGVPETIRAQTGYVDGQVAEYYDFGAVPAIVNPVDGNPVGVRVQPMYFFFDDKQRPLFSRPVRELRNGIDWLKGGEGVLDPNPKDFCKLPGADPTVCKADNDAQLAKSYPLRARDLLIDGARGTATYQRPLVDLIPKNNSGPRTQYTGLWEIIEVTAPKGYKPDSIKQVKTLKKALDSGKFKQRATGKVINCPILDERTTVVRGVTSRRVFRPRIELWYQRLLASCYLANGWETLGREDGVPYFAGAESDNDRFQTFDVVRITTGTGAVASQELAVPVSRLYTPAVSVSDQSEQDTATVTRIANNFISTGQPRHNNNDPGGYSPLRWMFDVRTQPDYVAGKWQAIADIDLSVARGRRSGSGDPLVQNVSLRGVSVHCSFPKIAVGGDGRNPPHEACAQPKDVKGDPTCNAEKDPLNPDDAGLECNPETCFCDVPLVGYGQRCGPGIGRCSTEKDSFSTFGYRCLLDQFCQRGCSGVNTHSRDNLGKEFKDQLDSRCGDVPGFICFEPLQTCIKFCDQNVTDPQQCRVDFKVGDETRNIQEGQTCQDFGLFVCTWPDTWTPKDFPLPQ